MATPHNDIVPGTVRLVDVGGDIHARHLEGNREIVLVPKPSSDPEDPLNRSRKRKLLSIGMCYVYTIGEMTIPDLFFAHDRGTYMGIYAFLLFGSNFLAPQVPLLDGEHKY
ncbi:hypothetical protein G7Y89_g15834 [Cudoniella acicularis]|uniref:Uncharacterized protein n=1 Tax=Cudoniella acicularis TaxID=354080 RepID=A0A8H4QFB0_9HELO|nr:hypothetical protein G7Y89_g15834 [Cudoniella acicularis]